MTRQSSIEQILERQARSWEVRRKLAGEGGEVAREALAHLQEGPWMTISRQLGSGGNELARRAGQELGWEVYDRKILQKIAEHTNARERVLAGLERGVVKPFDELLGRLLVAQNPGQVVVVREMSQIVWGLARKGHSIILGRAANWFLNSKYGLRLRVVAPFDQRVGRVAAESGSSLEDAKRQVHEHDDQRRAFIERYFGRNIDDPLGYDLVLNTGALDLDAASKMVIGALHAKLRDDA